MKFIENGKSRRTNFANIIDELSSQKYSMKKQISNYNGNLAEANDHDTQLCESSEEDVVEPLCTSMKKLTSAEITETPSTTLRRDSLYQETNYKQQMKTPSEMTKFNNKKESEQMMRGVSFRKSLIFDSGLTPHNDESNLSSKTIDEIEFNERPKAKTSLTFSESAISARSFYGKSNDQSAEQKLNSQIKQMSTHEIAAAITKNHKSKSRAKSKSKLQRSKKAPSLWRFSGTMKFNKFKRQHQIPKKNKSKKPNILKDSGITDENATDQTTNPIFTSNIEHNLRLQKILKDRTNTMNVSRDINWNGTPSTNSTKLIFGNSDEEDTDDENENLLQQTLVEDKTESAQMSNRKFFKSTTNSAAKYRVMGKLSATLKRGGDLKFQPIPKRKKKRSNKGILFIMRNFIEIQ